jgi:uncharacterized phage-associated protein
MAFVRQIPKWFSTRRAAQVTAFFADKAGGRINILRATKLIYLADRESMAEREWPVTGDDFVSMPFGPVNSYTYDLMKAEVTPEQTEIWSEFVAPRSGHDIPLSRPIEESDLDELSPADLRILHQTWEKYKKMADQFLLAEWTHKHCPEWQDPNGSSIPIAFATVYKKLDKDDPIELDEEIQAQRALAASFAS